MAPEIHSQTPFDPKKADIFSLGVVLFQMITGSFPFERAVETDVLYRHIYHNDFKTFWNRVDMNTGCESKLSQDLKALLEKMLCHNPDERLTINQVLRSNWLNQAVPDVTDVVEELGISHFFTFSECASESETSTNASSNSETSANAKTQKVWQLDSKVSVEKVFEAIREVFSDSTKWTTTSHHDSLKVDLVSDQKRSGICFQTVEKTKNDVRLEMTIKDASLNYSQSSVSDALRKCYAISI